MRSLDLRKLTQPGGLVGALYRWASAGAGRRAVHHLARSHLTIKSSAGVIKISLPDKAHLPICGAVTPRFSEGTNFDGPKFGSGRRSSSHAIAQRVGAVGAALGCLPLAYAGPALVVRRARDVRQLLCRALPR